MHDDVKVPPVTARLEDLGTAMKELPLSAIALFVAMEMYSEAVETKPGVRVYAGSSRRALQSLFPTKNSARADEVAAAIRPYLYKNGFSTQAGGGYRVPAVCPDASNWVEPEAATAATARIRSEVEEAEQKARILAGDVRKKWQCRFCARRFESQLGRGSHEGKGHSKTIYGVEVSGAKFLLLQLIQEHPWEHPRWYAKHLKQSPGSVSQLGRVLLREGLLTVVGSRQGVRYGPPDSAPQLKAAVEPEVNPTEPEPSPGSTKKLRPVASPKRWRATERYVSPAAAEALIAQIDERERAMRELKAEVDNIASALQMLLKKGES